MIHMIIWIIYMWHRVFFVCLLYIEEDERPSEIYVSKNIIAYRKEYGSKSTMWLKIYETGTYMYKVHGWGFDVQKHDYVYSIRK